MNARRCLVSAAFALLLAPAGSQAAVAPGLATFDLGLPVPQSRVDATARKAVLRPDGGLLVATAAGRGQVRLQAVSRDGRPDPSFGPGGVVVVPVPGSPTFVPTVLGLVRQADGRMVLAVPSPLGTDVTRVALVGLTAEGGLDPSFHGGQPVATDLTGGDLEATPDGGLVLTGAVYGGQAPTALTSSWAVERFGPDGAPVASFGAGGTVVLPGQDGRGTQVATAPDGRTTVLGVHDRQAVARRLLADGTPDPAWAGGGEVAVGSAALDLRLRPDGAADVLAADGTGPRLLRLLPDGSPDPAVAPQRLPLERSVPALVAAPDGSVVVVSAPDTLLDVPLRVHLQRFAADGTSTSDVLAPIGLAGGAAAPNHGRPLDQTGAILVPVGLRADGTLVLAGSERVQRATGEGEGLQRDLTAVASLTADGLPDSAFGGPAAPARLTLRVPGQRVGRALEDRQVRLLVGTSETGLIDVSVSSRGKRLAHVTLPSFAGGRRGLGVLLLRPVRHRLQGRHRVPITVRATFRDVVGQEAAATAHGLLR